MADSEGNSEILFPREPRIELELSFIRQKDSVSLGTRHLTSSPPIEKRIWIGRYNNINVNFHGIRRCPHERTHNTTTGMFCQIFNFAVLLFL